MLAKTRPILNDTSHFLFFLSKRYDMADVTPDAVRQSLKQCMDRVKPSVPFIPALFSDMRV